MDLLLGDATSQVDFVVFDCDGVLLDSMPAKAEAFRLWVPGEQAHLREDFMKYIVGGFGRSRQLHVRYFYEELAGLQIDDAFVQREVDRFTAICEPRCEDVGWIDGSREFAVHCRNEGATTFVLSGTPQRQLEEMLAANAGDGLFHRVVGSPPGKVESLIRLIEETGFAGERTVFVGDAQQDLDAAEAVGARFVYLPSITNRPVGAITREVANLMELVPQPG